MESATRIICLLGDNTLRLEQNLPQVHWQHHDTPDTLSPPIDLIVLDPASNEQCISWLQALRSDDALCHLPIFSAAREPHYNNTVNALLDGYWDTLSGKLGWLQQWQERERQLKLDEPNPLIQSTLRYLWSRPQTQLVPVTDWRAASLYHYPLLSCIGGSHDAANLLLEQLHSRRLIRPNKLYDRIRTCSSCHSGHLSYVDQCPSCHSLDIQQQPAIHCFNCGHVAAQTKFLRNGVLQCPNCQTRLRHIGSDYDRPMENYQCNSCKLMFIEPDIRARCLSCHTSHQPESLRVETVFDYQLSERGTQLCREGDIAWSIGNLVLLGSLIPQEMFRFSLSWQDQLCVRYPAQNYSVLAIRLANIPDMVSRQGFKETMVALELLGQDLRSQLRNTDLCTQLAEDLLLLLLPNTPAEYVDTLRQKINRVHLQNSDGEREVPEILLASYSSGRAHQAQNAAQLIDMLANEIRY